MSSHMSLSSFKYSTGAPLLGIAHTKMFRGLGKLRDFSPDARISDRSHNNSARITKPLSIIDQDQSDSVSRKSIYSNKVLELLAKTRRSYSSRKEMSIRSKSKDSAEY